jgi:hypothetical protein
MLSRLEEEGLRRTALQSDVVAPLCRWLATITPDRFEARGPAQRQGYRSSEREDDERGRGRRIRRCQEDQGA